MNKIFKLFSVTLILIMMSFLSGCELSLNDVKKTYDIDKEINGTSLTTEELLEKLEDIVFNFEMNKYCEITAVSTMNNDKLNLTIKYDFSGELLKDFKLHINIKSKEEELQYFIDDEVLYAIVKYDEVVEKEKANLKDLLGNVSIDQAKQELLKECMSFMDFEGALTKESYQELYEAIKDSLSDEEEMLKATIDSNSNLVIDVNDDDEQARMVFNSDNKLIYLGGKDNKDYITVIFSYSKPRFNFPSTDGFIE